LGIHQRTAEIAIILSGSFEPNLGIDNWATIGRGYFDGNFYILKCRLRRASDAGNWSLK